jgi:hypothetical protein
MYWRREIFSPLKSGNESRTGTKVPDVLPFLIGMTQRQLAPGNGTKFLIGEG